MFYWVDDTPLAGHYSAWARGEPDHNFVKCVHIYNESDKFGEWNNIRCILDDAEENAAPAVSCQKKNIWGSHPFDAFCRFFTTGLQR